VVFLGVNLHARDRYERVPTKFGPEVGTGTTVLDADCGNGMLSFQAWKRGATVLGVSIKQKEIDGCRLMFGRDKNISEERLRFENVNLCTLPAHQAPFSVPRCWSISATTVAVCQLFFDLLKPGGCVHITTPNADHSYNRTFRLELDERRGHVRGEPLGFRLEEVSGLGGPVREAFNNRIKSIQGRFGAAAGPLLFVLSLPSLVLCPREPRTPFSLYARARKVA